MIILFVNLVAANCILLSNVSCGQQLQALAFDELPDGILAAEDQLLMVYDGVNNKAMQHFRLAKPR